MIRLGTSLLLALGLLAVAGGLGGWQWIQQRTAAPIPFESTRPVALAPQARSDAEPQPEFAEPPLSVEPVAAAGELQEEDEPTAQALLPADDVPAAPDSVAFDPAPREPEPEPALGDAGEPDDREAPADLDRSADLVRRMLSLYQRSGDRR